jgi:tRNA U34 2-thiouridine synthase MnmA/TrmU
MSGGVDSSVAAWLLKQQGLEVFGVYMHNWDSGDEAGAGQVVCTSEKDFADAKAVAGQLGIPLYEADFVGKYWTLVFEEFLAGLAQGLTPNPDLACNSYIKFGALMEFARAKGADVLATGHYARLEGAMYSLPNIDGSAPTTSSRASSDPGSLGVNLPTTCHSSGKVPSRIGSRRPESNRSSRVVFQPGVARLLRGVDAEKDQSYFLAGVAGSQLYRAVFPVGMLLQQFRPLLPSGSASFGIDDLQEKHWHVLLL